MKTRIDNTDKKARTRVQLDFNPEGYNQLARLQDQTESPTMAHVIRTALHFYGWWVAQRAQGYRLQLVRGKDEVREVELFFG